MRILDRYSVLALIAPTKATGLRMVRRWSRAADTDPELVRDVIEMGGVLQTSPVEFRDGVPGLAAIDPHTLAYEAGQREMAVKLLSLMAIGPAEMETLMQENYDAR